MDEAPAMYRLQLLLYPLCRRDRVRELGRNIPAQLDLSDLLDPMEEGTKLLTPLSDFYDKYAYW